MQTIPVIVISGWTQPEDREATMAAGFQEHLAKPLGADKLVAVIGRWASAAAQKQTVSASALEIPPKL